MWRETAIHQRALCCSFLLKIAFYGAIKSYDVSLRPLGFSASKTCWRCNYSKKVGIQCLFNKNCVTTFDRFLLNTYVFLVIEWAILRFSGKQLMIKSIMVKYCMCNKLKAPLLQIAGENPGIRTSSKARVHCNMLKLMLWCIHLGNCYVQFVFC